MDDARLKRLLGGPQLQALRKRLRARYERGAHGDEFALKHLAPFERRALESLLGRPARSADSMRIRRSELDATVARAGLAADFRSALEVLDGPLIDRKAERLEHALEWRKVIESVAASAAEAIVSDVAGVALLKRLSGGDPRRGRTLLESARLVLDRLPAQGIPLAQLAAEVLGDSHALDAGCAVATLVLRTLRGATGAEVEEEAVGDTRRDRWARAGVSINELAMPVLCLNLPARRDTPAGVLACAATSHGEPVHLSLRALLGGPPHWELEGCTVYVCENASVVAAAAQRLGPGSAPLVCTDGMPGAAQQTLLRQLAAAGARLRYHGDFDWPGLIIGNFVLRSFGALPWRFGAADYREARTDAANTLSGHAVVAAWDAELAGALAERGVAVHEEAVVEGLLADLLLCEGQAGG